MTGLNAARHRVTNWTMNRDEARDAPSHVLELPAWNVNGICPDGSVPRAVRARCLPSYLGEAGYRDGGKVYDVFNIEFGFPLARERRKTIVKFVTFFDAGGAWDNVRSMQMRVGKGEHHVKTDVGFGIRFTTPAFPIRLDWGYGFQHRPGESKYQINFGIGNLF